MANVYKLVSGDKIYFVCRAKWGVYKKLLKVVTDDAGAEELETALLMALRSDYPDITSSDLDECLLPDIGRALRFAMNADSEEDIEAMKLEEEKRHPLEVVEMGAGSS